MNIRSSTDRRLRLVLALVLFAVYGAVSVGRHLRMETSGFDLGIFEEAVRGYAGLGRPLVALKGADYNLLGDHFSPILALLAPVYRLFPGAVTLLLAQAALLAASTLPVTRLAMRTVGRWGGAAIGLAYGLSWGLWATLAFDFHEVAFAVPLAAFAVEALVCDRAVAAMCWALPLLLVKEDQGLLVVGIGACLFVRGHRRLGAGLAVAAVMAMALAVLVLVPLANPEGVYTYAESGEWTGGNPVARLLLPGDKWTLAAVLLAPTLLLALCSPLCLLLVLPLAARFWSLNPGYWDTLHHYNAVLMPVLFLAFVDGLRRLGHAPGRGALVEKPSARPARYDGAGVPSPSGGGGAVTTLTRPVRTAAPGTRSRSAIAVGLAPVGALVVAAAMLPVPSLAAPTPQVAVVKRVLAAIPDGVTVAAANHLAPQLTERCTVSLFPYLTPPGGAAPWNRPTADWVAALDDPDDFPVPAAEQKQFREALPAMGYRTVAMGGGVTVYRWAAG
ncbi:DUF2079 domain-containing protein [Kitasatospora sp. GP82]|uniref:DUF2079 domain-containing protein n=1 Tax=Kitasatospora sp. GP82 TaxID=3035089 RepID=UPI0024740F61|nr:DUF2079 domain-containing protein [Kitasatospora sp. GP82]